MDEKTGCAILFDVCKSAGYKIKQNVKFKEEGLKFIADGWDKEARVGYEFITDEAGDRKEFDEKTCDELEARMRRDELHFFLCDELVDLSEEELRNAATQFLIIVQKRN